MHSDEARANMTEATRVTREALRELETARGGALFGGVADLIEASQALIRAVRAYLHATKSDGV